jgi:hypothetical protein
MAQLSEDDEVISFSSSLPNLENLLTELSTPREEKDGDSAVMAHFDFYYAYLLWYGLVL